MWILAVLVILAIIYIPTEKKLIIYSIRFNEETNEFKVTLQNSFQSPLLVKGTYTINRPDGTIITIGDIAPIEIQKEGYFTLTYDLEDIHPRKEVKAIIEYFEPHSTITNTIHDEIIPTSEI